MSTNTQVGLLVAAALGLMGGVAACGSNDNPQQTPPEPLGPDAGLPSLDAGFPSIDAGLPMLDAGLPPGFPFWDGGLPPGFPPWDAAAPPFPWDAGFPLPWDAGVPFPWDAGVPLPWDAGVPFSWDGGLPSFAAALPQLDAGGAVDASARQRQVAEPGRSSVVVP